MKTEKEYIYRKSENLSDWIKKYLKYNSYKNNNNTNKKWDVTIFAITMRMN